MLDLATRYAYCLGMATRTKVNHDPRAALRLYLAGHRLTQRDLAERLDITIAGLNDILTGRRGPGRQLMFRIEDETGIAARLWDGQ